MLNFIYHFEITLTNFLFYAILNYLVVTLLYIVFNFMQLTELKTVVLLNVFKLYLHVQF